MSVILRASFQKAVNYDNVQARVKQKPLQLFNILKGDKMNDKLPAPMSLQECLLSLNDRTQYSWGKKTLKRQKKGIKEILAICNFLITRHKVPEKVIGYSLGLFDMLAQKNMITAKIEITAYAVVHISARTCQSPITLKELLDSNKQILPLGKRYIPSEREVRKNFLLLSRKLGIEILSPGPVEYVDRFCAKLDLAKETAEKTKQIINKNEAESRIPSGTAGAAIKLAAEENEEFLTFRTVEEAIGVNRTTIREIYKSIYLNRVCKKLKLPPKIAEEAKKIVENTELSRETSGICSAAIKLAAEREGINISTSKLKITKIRKATIEKTYQKLKREAKASLPFFIQKLRCLNTFLPGQDR